MSCTISPLMLVELCISYPLGNGLGRSKLVRLVSLNKVQAVLSQICDYSPVSVNESLQGNGEKQECIMSLVKALEEAHLSELSADKDSVLCFITANLSVIISYLNFRLIQIFFYASSKA